MQHADEMRGSEGKKCVVTDLQTAKRYDGVVREWDDDSKKAVVELSSGRSVRVGYGFVELVGEEEG